MYVHNKSTKEVNGKVESVDRYPNNIIYKGINVFILVRFVHIYPNNLN